MRDLPHYRHLVRGVSPAGERKPLLVFLHGRGERGSDLRLLDRHGPPALFPRFGLERFVLVAPQCPGDAVWNADLLGDFVAAAIDAYRADRARVHLTGISMGGLGAWELGTGRPDLFCAIAPVCGGGDPRKAERLVAAGAAKPVWLFHSAGDRVMPVQGTDRVFDSLRDCNGFVTYTRYHRLDHVQTWEHAYGSQVLYQWFLGHRQA